MLPVLQRRPRQWENPFDLLEPRLSSLMSRVWPGNGQDDLLAAYPVDIHEDESGISVEAEMPGFKREEITVTLEGGILTIAGERKEEPAKGEEHLKERRYTRVLRSFTVPTSLDETKIEAKLENGVLKLRLPKSEEVKAKRIAIK